jgi:hypothetical protein
MAAATSGRMIPPDRRRRSLGIDDGADTELLEVGHGFSFHVPDRASVRSRDRRGSRLRRDAAATRAATFSPSWREYRAPSRRHVAMKSALRIRETPADDILKRLDLGVLFQSFLAQQLADPGSRLGAIAGRFHDRRGAPCMVFLQVLAPGEIADAAFRVGIARNEPAFDVLSPGGDAKGLGGIGTLGRQRRRHAPAVDQCCRQAFTTHSQGGGILRIGRIDGSQNSVGGCS